MRRTSLTAGLYLLLLFFSGIAVGAFGLHLYTNTVRATSPRDPDEFRRKYIAELQTKLKLTDDQVSKLGPILDETRRRHRELMEKHRPEMKAIQDEQVSKIRAILMDSQQSEYTKMVEEREKQRRRDHPERP